MKETFNRIHQELTGGVRATYTGRAFCDNRAHGIRGWYIQIGPVVVDVSSINGDGMKSALVQDAMVAEVTRIMNMHNGLDGCTRPAQIDLAGTIGKDNEFLQIQQ